MCLPEGDRNSELLSMIQQGKEIDSINYTSEENNKIYMRNRDKIAAHMK